MRPIHPVKKKTIRTTDKLYSINDFEMPIMAKRFTSFLFLINANNCSPENIKNARPGSINAKEAGTWNFCCSISLKINSNTDAITAIKKEMIKLLVKDEAN